MLEEEKEGEENQIKFKSIDLIWLVSGDLIKPINDMDKVIERLLECPLCEVALRLYNAEDRIKKKEIGEILPESNNDNKLMNLFCWSDFLTLDEVYIEGKNYSRFLLKGLKLKLPNSEEFYDCSVLLTISKLGVGVFSFWIPIKTELNSREIAELQLIPFYGKKISAMIPLELLQERGIMNEYASSVYEKKKRKLKKNEAKFLLVENVGFGALFNLYWYAIINRIFNLKFKSKNLLEDKLRYEEYFRLPFVIVNSTEPEFKYSDEFIEKNPRQIYQILSHLDDIDYKWIYSEIMDNVLKPNITERRDVAYLDSLGSFVLVFSSQTKNIIENQIKHEKEFISIESGYQRIIIEALTVLEILQIQRHYIGFLTKKLSRPIADMNPREISIMRSYLSNTLDMYYGNVTGNALSRMRLEHGELIMEIDEDVKMISKKIELLGDALNSFNSLKTSSFQIALALILGIMPLFYYFSPLFNNPIWDSIFAISITVGIIIISWTISKWYWKHLKQKEL